MSDNTTQPIRFLCIGHFCHDLLDSKHILGGTASYSSIVARKLGVSTAVMTSVGDDFEFYPIFNQLQIPVFNKKSAKTTVFENIYTEGGRIQYLHQRGEVIFKNDIPDVLKQVPIVQICPIDDEIDVSVLSAFPNALIGLTIQGWLRQWDEKGRISPKEMDWQQLKGVDAVIMSDADIRGFESAIPTIAQMVRVLVMTQGAEGATVFYEDKKYHFPSYPVKEVEATGAGDVFATAFLIKYEETDDIALSTAYAHAAASFVVEGVGIKNLTNIDKIEERYELYCAQFLTNKENLAI